jgi:hypothetical protein
MSNNFRTASRLAPEIEFRKAEKGQARVQREDNGEFVAHEILIISAGGAGVTRDGMGAAASSLILLRFSIQRLLIWLSTASTPFDSLNGNAAVLPSGE